MTRRALSISLWLPGTNITLPSTANHADYTAVLTALDEANSPSLFSLPVNVDRTVQAGAVHSSTSHLNLSRFGLTLLHFSP
jgi:hypothetical protein